jgi:small subunit ribosomal protein S18
MNGNQGSRYQGQQGYQGQQSQQGPQGQRVRKLKACTFCSEGVAIDYKNIDLLNRYVNEYGRIRPRRQTGTCAKHQRSLAIAVKRARHIALLPFAAE